MEVIKLFKQLVSIKSVTPEGIEILDFIKNYLPEFEAKYFNKNGVSNLFLTKKFDDGVHLCLAGHVDVVPAGSGWKYPPFLAIEEDGFIYGRGTQDMKSGVAAMVESAKNLEYFPGTLSILLTSDEEGEAKFGTKYVLEELKKTNQLPDFAMIFEPTSENIMGDVIKIGRRGSINATLTIYGKQGHVAYPEKTINPIHLFLDKLQIIAGHQFDSGDDFFAPSQLIITDIRGGMEVTNVTPDKLKIMFNVRNSTKTSMQDVKRFVDEVCQGLNYDLDIFESSKPFLTNSNSEIVKKLSEAVETVCKIKPNLTTGGGTSDARFMGEFNIDVAEFGVINDRIHSKNERTSIQEVEKLYQVCNMVLKSFS